MGCPVSITKINCMRFVNYFLQLRQSQNHRGHVVRTHHEKSFHIQKSNDLLQTAGGQSLLFWPENWTDSIKMLAFISNFISVKFISACQFVHVHMCTCALSGWLISILQYIHACKGSVTLKYVVHIYASKTFINMHPWRQASLVQKRKRTTTRRQEVITHMYRQLSFL